MHTLDGGKQLLFRPAVLSPGPRVAWEGVARPSLRATHESAVFMWVTNLFLAFSQNFCGLYPAVLSSCVAVTGWEIASSAQCDLPQPSPFCPHFEGSLLECALCVLPYISPRAGHKYKTAWLLPLHLVRTATSLTCAHFQAGI